MLTPGRLQLAGRECPLSAGQLVCFTLAAGARFPPFTSKAQLSIVPWTKVRNGLVRAGHSWPAEGSRRYSGAAAVSSFQTKVMSTENVMTGGLELSAAGARETPAIYLRLCCHSD